MSNSNIEELKLKRAELEKQFALRQSEFKKAALRRDSEGIEIRNAVKVKLDKLTSEVILCNKKIIELSRDLIGKKDS